MIKIIFSKKDFYSKVPKLQVLLMLRLLTVTKHHVYSLVVIITQCHLNSYQVNIFYSIYNFKKFKILFIHKKLTQRQLSIKSTE